MFTLFSEREMNKNKGRGRGGEGGRMKRGGKERGRDLPDQCQNASYAPVFALLFIVSRVLQSLYIDTSRVTASV